MKLLTTLFLIIISFNYSILKAQSNFSEFSGKFKEIDFPFQINDSLAFEEWNFNDFITTDHVVEFDLITKYVNTDYPLELQDYKCSRVGKYRIGDYVVLLYKTYTTEAGSGNPKIILLTFTLTGEQKSDAVVLWDNVEDPFYSQKVMLTIPNNTTFVIKSIVRDYGFLQDKIVPKRVTEKIISYEIRKDGIIEKKEEITKEIFIDTNPDILDDFPDK